MRKGKRFTYYEDETGFIKAHYLTDGTLYIDELYIFPEFRGLGHGKRIAKSLPCGTMLLASPLKELDGSETKVNLIKFYESCGFVLEPDKYNNPYMRMKSD